MHDRTGHLNFSHRSGVVHAPPPSPSLKCAALPPGGFQETFWSACGRRDEVVGGPRRWQAASGTSSWMAPPLKGSSTGAVCRGLRESACRATSVLRVSSAESSTGFGGGFSAAGCFGCGWARGYQKARGLPRRRRMDTRWEALGKRLALVLCRNTLELRVGGLVGKGWGLQLGGEQASEGPLRALVVS